MSNLVELPRTGLATNNKDIAKYLHEQADGFENEDSIEVRTVVLVVEGMDGSLYRSTIGQPSDLARVTGLLTMQIIRDSLGV
jgi:hypothetical protein